MMVPTTSFSFVSSNGILRNQMKSTISKTNLYAEAGNSNNDNIEMMRKMLESSWNDVCMGAVPSTPESAAESSGKFSSV